MSSSFTSLHITALDAIVNVNSLFTLAVFVGLTWNPNDPENNLNSDPACAPTAAIAENLIAFHVYSFSSFLFSSLVALALKQAIRLSRTTSFHYPAAVEHLVAHVNRSSLRVGMLVSAVGSVFGCSFLMLALVNVAQIKLGTLACGSSHTYAAVVPLLILVPIALLIYASLVLVQTVIMEVQKQKPLFYYKETTSPTSINLFRGWTVNKAYLTIWAFASAIYSCLKAASFIKKTSIYIRQVIFYNFLIIILLMIFNQCF
ncbi:uncharacterized protein LOC108327597 isoform X1 [Vigna angularis]|uniref:uncharacterized protein LOC108327597 isoform X1 n=1 Tax=Phaseolus angularis TaxID=3914 RepID=UPI0022B3BA69|nr:uncharacterized protein LOC108327597 isoform X1 [Vigna angularis]